MARLLSWRRLVIVLGVADIAIAGILAVSLVPIDHPFAIRGAVLMDASYCSGVQFPRGSTVNFHWVTASNVYFGVWDCSGGTGPYSSTGTSNGSGTFVSTGGAYEFGAYCPAKVRPPDCETANVTGSFVSPLVVW